MTINMDGYKKILTAIGLILAAILAAQTGQKELAQQIVEIGMALLVAQGAADFGKKAAKVEK